MVRIEKTVFISYRRTNASWALAISQYLTHRGFDVFIDYTKINSGDFEQVIIENIGARAHFLVLLAPSALDRCGNPHDWLRREIELAMERKRNIIPIILEGFDFGAPETIKYLTGELEKLKHYNGLNLPADYFEEGMQRLCERFLNISLETVLHPVSKNVRKIVNDQKRAVAEVAKVDERTLSAQEWCERGYKTKDLHEQIRLFTVAIELDSKLVEAYNNRGACYNELGQIKLAFQDLDQAIKLNPELSLAYANRGIIYDNLRQFKQAIQEYNQAIKLNPELFEAYCYRGNIYNYMGQYGRAIEDYNQAIKLNPEYSMSYYNMACSYTFQGNVDEAIHWLSQALTKDPKEHCEFLKHDSDFDSIRGEEEFQKLLEKYCDGE